MFYSLFHCAYVSLLIWKAFKTKIRVLAFSLLHIENIFTNGFVHFLQLEIVFIVYIICYKQMLLK